MAAITAEQRAELVALFLTMFGQAPTTTQLARMVTARENGTSLLNIASAASVILEDQYAQVASMDAETFADYLADALLASDVPASARAWATNWVITNVSGNKSKVQVIVEAVQAIRATTNPNYASSQAELSADVTVALNNIDNPVITGQTFTLTAGSDTRTGSTGGDTFDAGLTVSSLQTLNSGDRLDGGSGTDELFAIVNTSTTPTSITGIENINLTNITTAATVDLTNSSGIQTVTNQASTVGLTIAGISKTTNVTVRDTNVAGQTITFNDVSGLADSATINIQNLTGAAGLSVAGVETLTLNSSGSATNAVALTATSTTTLNVTGTQGLTLGTLGASVRKIDASGNTASLGTGVTATFANASANLTVIGGAGNDSITSGSSTGNDNFAMGAGNDTVTYTANLDTNDTIDGGEGTDTLVGTSANLIALSATTPTTFNIANVETLRTSDAFTAGATITVPNIATSATRLNLQSATGTSVTAGAATVVGGAGSFTLGLGGFQAAPGDLQGALTVTDTGTGTADSLTIINSAANSGTSLGEDVFNGQNIVVNGYETVTINSGTFGAGQVNSIGTVTVTGDVGGTENETVRFTGANRVSVGVISADVVDASGITATQAGTIFDMVTGSTATTITGSAGIDDLHGNTTTGSSINGAGGNDVITGGTGNDTLLGGEGNDSITTGGGVDSVDGGAGDDTVVATLASGNTVAGGEGTDILSLATGATATSATGVSGFETLRLTANVSQDMVQFIDNGSFTRLEGAFAGPTTAFTNVSANVTTLATTVAGNSSSVTRLVDTNSNALNVVLLGGAATTLVTANNEETINLSTDATVGATTLTTLTATDLHTLNISGSNAITIGTLSSNTTTTGTTLTINGAANTGGITVSAANSTIVANITGSLTASNNLTGSAGADTVVGGNLADTIVGGGQSDILTGGGGADTFQFTLGDDTVPTSGDSGGTPSATVFDTITDFASASDIIDVDAAITIVTNGTATSGVAAISAAGIASFNIADSTLALRITAVEAGINAGGVAAAGQAAAFQFGSDAYVFVSDGNDGVGAGDLLIKLTGVNLSDAAYDTLTLTGGNATLA